MNPIGFILSLVTVGFLFFNSLPFFTVYAKNKKERLVRKLCREGAADHLIFCSQEILHNKVIGIDGIHRKIMILERTNNKYECSTISLNEVHHCHLVTHHARPGLTQHHQPAEHPVATLELLFDINNEAEPASIVFAEGIITSTAEFAFLKAKADYWCTMFSKMLNIPAGTGDIVIAAKRFADLPLEEYQLGSQQVSILRPPSFSEQN